MRVGDLPDVDVAEDGGDDAVAGPGEVSAGEDQLLVVALGQAELLRHLKRGHTLVFSLWLTSVSL